MATYVTVDDVDALLGPDWAAPEDKQRAVLEANIWLTAQNVVLNDPIDEDVRMASALLAQEAANGRLYVDSKGTIQKKRVKADTVESETVYAEGSTSTTGALAMINDLIKPYIIRSASTRILKRL